MREAAEYTGLSAQTLRKLIDEGEIKAKRIGSRGDRYVEKGELDRFMGRRPPAEPKGCAVYARVSTRKQKDAGSLDRQKSRLLDYCGSSGYKVAHVVEDVASGVNEDRRGLSKLVDLSKKGEIDRIIVEYKDRLARFGYDYLKELFSTHGVEVECVDEDGEKSYEEELVEDMLAIVSSLSTRLYGRRGGKKVKEKTEEAIKGCKQQFVQNCFHSKIKPKNSMG